MKTIAPRSYPVALALLFAVPAVHAGTPANGKASFTAAATAGLRLEGTSDALSAAWEGDTLVVTVPTASFDTGIELRDKHLREHIEANRYPTAVLRVPLTAIQLPAPGASRPALRRRRSPFTGR